MQCFYLHYSVSETTKNMTPPPPTDSKTTAKYPKLRRLSGLAKARCCYDEPLFVLIRAHISVDSYCDLINYT